MISKRKSLSVYAKRSEAVIVFIKPFEVNSMTVIQKVSHNLNNKKSIHDTYIGINV